ncbi:MAG: hypothetical protein ACYDEO_23630 [Aggregatilineales bacterium]
MFQASSAPAKTVTAQTFEIEPFDVMMHATESGLRALQSRIAGYLSTLGGPARFVSYQQPANLQTKIDQVKAEVLSLSAVDPNHPRVELLTEYRRFYETLQLEANYQHSACYVTLWNDDHPRALSAAMSAVFDTPARPVETLPPLFEGQYKLKSTPFWHLAPIGRPGGRLLWAILTSYEFLPSGWSFFRPLAPLLGFNFPLALSIDVQKTFERSDGIDALEQTILAYTVHLSSARGEDSRAVQRIKDCRAALSEINAGDALHLVQFSLALAAPSGQLLRQHIRQVVNETRAWFKVRAEDGLLLSHAVQMFSTEPSKHIDLPTTTWPVTSRELALMLAPVGYRKLTGTRGVLRGEAGGPAGSYPFFHDSWNDAQGRPEKRVNHEVWVGVPGYGKTFACNTYLSREYVEQGVPFDLLEPMGHGAHVARTLGLPWFVLSSERTKLNPCDVMFERPVEQKSHVIRIYETVLGRLLTGNQRANLERGLLGQALDVVYSGFPKLAAITPDLAPTTENVCGVLAGLGDKEQNRRIARDLADEIASLSCGTGPFAEFLNGQTNIDLSFRGKALPRIFSFHEMEGDPILQAIAYTQVLSAIRRDSLADEQPRIIAVDEVFRLMRHPSLLDFLIEAAKTYRTKRKKLIVIDQQMSIFLEGKARLVFENCPIRLIFNQRQGLNVFYDDQAFQHYNQEFRDLIARLQRYQFLMDIEGTALHLLYNRPSAAELARFGST